MSKKLYRSRDHKMLTGLCGGLAEYFDMDVSLMRLLWVIVSIILGVGVGGLIIYLIASMIVPVESY